jgi:hypothetical protein
LLIDYFWNTVALETGEAAAAKRTVVALETGEAAAAKRTVVALETGEAAAAKRTVALETGESAAKMDCYSEESMALADSLEAR